MADFDFGTIIYLIIIILATVFGGRKKKKSQVFESSNKTSKKTGRSFLDEFLKELQGQPEVFTSKEEKISHPYAPTSRPQPVQEMYDFDSVEKNIPKYQVVDKVDEDYFEKRKDYFESNKVTMNFDAIMEGGLMTTKPGSFRTPVYRKSKPKIKMKEAVIYSEILNRKQW